MVLGHVQAMFERFQESFERRLSQSELRLPRECWRLPLLDPSSGEIRVTEFSSLEDSGPDTMMRVASVVHALSPGAAQADRHIVLAEHGDDTRRPLGYDSRATGAPVALCRVSCRLRREVMLSQEEAREEEEEEE